MNLAGKVFTPSHMRNDPLIFAGYAVQWPRENPSRSKATKVPADMPPLEAMYQQSDLLIRDLWQKGTASVHDMRVVNTDAKSHLAKTP